MHKLLFHPRVHKKLKQFHPNDRQRILRKIDALAKTPQSKALDIKKLANTQNSFRLRAGDLRAIFEIEGEEKIIYIWDIDYRGSIY